MAERIPAEVFPPGEFLRDELEARNWTQTEFAEIIHRPVRLVNEIIAGKRGITPETARAFSAALGTSPQFWLNLETAYQLSKTAPAPESIGRAAALRDHFPVREMIKRGWLEDSENIEVLEQRVFDYFGIQQIGQPVMFSHAARRNHEEELSGIQLAWLFRVRQLASALIVPAYSKKALRGALSDIEELMEEPEEIRHVSRILADVGVRLVVVEPVPGSKIEGVCFWIDGNKSPVIGLSLKFGRIDNFWFNLRHEIEHVLNEDGKEAVVVDDTDILAGNDDLTEQEKVANAAAENFCVPTRQMEDFIARLDPMYSTKSFLGFSKIIGRHPGIVAGQLQRKTDRWDLFRKYQVDIRRVLVATTMTDGYGQTIPAAI